MSKTLKEYIKIILKNIDMGLEKNRKDKLIELAQTIKKIINMKILLKLYLFVPIIVDAVNFLRFGPIFHLCTLN